MSKAESIFSGRPVTTGSFVVERLDELKSLRVPALYSRYTDVVSALGLNRTLQEFTRHKVPADIAHTRFTERRVAARLGSLVVLHYGFDDVNGAQVSQHQFGRTVCESTECD